MNAQSAINFLQAAAGDIAYAEAEEAIGGYAEPRIKKAFNKYIKSGGDPDYFADVHADDLYSDTNFQIDLLGDHIYGQPNRAELLNDLEKEFPKAVATLRKRNQ